MREDVMTAPTLRISPNRARLAPALAALALLALSLAGPSRTARAEVPAEARKGAALFAESSYTEAAEAFRQATIAAPDDARWRYDLGLSEALDEKYEEALNNLSATSRLATPEVAAAALYNVGNVQMANGKFAEAARAYREALMRNPRDLEAKHNLELALRELQKPQDSSQNQPGGENDSTKQDQEQKQDQQQQKDQEQKQQDSPEDQKQKENQQGEPEQDSTGQPPKPKPGDQADSTLSREQAERILRALADEEARLRSQAKKTNALPAPGGKDW